MTPNGSAIRTIREARGMSLQRLARLIKRSPGFVSRIETGERGASRDTLDRIAIALRTPINAITRETTRDQDAPGPRT
ncbi:helix-turn-helix domain-containing protein [Streptomyces sp. NPDC127166]|uniref:helix-turn-helix domain-containing protein n=1 Tax=Streptomyces sp. NPDC127166 TaxID=3345380 RepID=UPI0036371BDC